MIQLTLYHNKSLNKNFHQLLKRKKLIVNQVYIHFKYRHVPRLRLSVPDCFREWKGLKIRQKVPSFGFLANIEEKMLT